MTFLSQKEQFYYVATGLLKGQCDWVFISMLHDEQHIDINIMIACPAMDNVQNIEATLSSFKYPRMHAEFVALAHGENPYSEDTQE